MERLLVCLCNGKVTLYDEAFQLTAVEYVELQVLSLQMHKHY